MWILTTLHTKSLLTQSFEIGGKVRDLDGCSLDHNHIKLHVVSCLPANKETFKKEEEALDNLSKLANARNKRHNSDAT